MSQQKSLKLPEKKTQSDLTKLRKQFEEEKEKKVDRIVMLKVSVCCGCGCNYFDLKRTVPFDSKFNDGDAIKPQDIQRGDLVDINKNGKFDDAKKYFK